MPDPIKLSAKTPFAAVLPGDRVAMIRRPQDEPDAAKRVAGVGLDVLAAALQSQAGAAFTITPTIALGGIAAGVVFTGNNQQWWTKALVVFQSPAFSAFAVAGLGSRTVEVGTIIPGGTVAFTWSTANAGNVAANTVDIANVTEGGPLLADNTGNDGAHDAAATALTVAAGENRRYRISAQDTQGATFSADVVISGALALFFGAGIAPTTRAQAVALGGFQLTSQGNTGAIDVAAGLDFCILLPPGKTLASVRHRELSNATITSAYVAQPTVSIDNASGAPIPGYTPYLLHVTSAYGANNHHDFTFA